MSQKLLDALPAIYDAAAADNKWPQALDAVSNALEARGAILVASDLVGLPYQVQKWCSLYRDEHIQHYFANFGGYEQKGAELLYSNPAGTVIRDTDAWPDFDEIRYREDVAFLRDHYGVEHRAVVCLTKGKSWSDMLALQFADEWTDVPGQSWQTLELALPHLAKVVEINRVFTLLRLRYQAALTALDHIGIGMCVVRSEGQILVSNSEAERLFSSKDGLYLGPDGRISAVDEATTAQIREAIALTGQTAAGEASRQEVTIACSRRSKGNRYLLEICPLRDGHDELGEQFSGSLVCIIDPDAMKEISSSGLAALFAFSPAEAEVCDQLLLGRSTNEIAEARDVSPETVRTQIKALYAKAGAANRVELIRMAISASPPIR